VSTGSQRKLPRRGIRRATVSTPHLGSQIWFSGGRPCTWHRSRSPLTRNCCPCTTPYNNPLQTRKSRRSGCPSASLLLSGKTCAGQTQRCVCACSGSYEMQTRKLGNANSPRPDGPPNTCTEQRLLRQDRAFIYETGDETERRSREDGVPPNPTHD
jgi:hypothetical protein